MAALEEIGARLVVVGEKEFTTSMKRAQKATDQTGEAVVKTGKKTEQAASPLKKFADGFQQITGMSLPLAGGLMAVGVATRAVIGYLRGAITDASNLNETVSKSKVVFGEAANTIEDMGNVSARAMGMSKNEAMGAAATYGNLFTSLGMTKQASADMSVKLVQLAADLASFNNIPVADALDKIRAGLVGEAEPLRAVGININEVTLRQEAMNMGLEVGKGALNGAVKAQAAYSLMLKQSANAQGDFARTSDGAANQQRILEASSKDLSASIGEGLLPAWVEVLKVGNKFLEFLDNLINAQKKERAAIAASTVSYDKYYEADIKAIKATYHFTDAQAEAYMAATRMTRSEYDALQSIKELSGYTEDEAQRAQKDLTKAVKGTTGAIDEQAVAADALKQRMDEYATLLAGEMTTENKKYDQSLKTQRDRLDEIWFKIDALNKQSYLTKEQKKEREDLQKEYDKELAKIKEIGEEHDKAQKKIMAGWLLTRLNLNTLTAEEEAFYLKTIMDWGLIEQSEVDAYLQTLKYAEGVDNSTTSVSELEAALLRAKGVQDGLNSKSIVWTIETRMISTGTGTGGLFPQFSTPDIPPKPPDGPNYTWDFDVTTRKWYKVWGRASGGAVVANEPVIVGERGPEPFIPSQSGYILNHDEARRIFERILSEGQMPKFETPVRSVRMPSPSNVVRSASVVRNSWTTNAYNLQVMTNQSPQVVQQSFSIMRMLAG